MRHRLFTPGPTPVPERVTLRMAEPMVHHRAPHFTQIFREVIQGLKYLFQTHGDVLTFTTSGTGGMEAAVANLLSSSNRVITVEGGKFGRRWTEICRSYGVQVQVIEIPWDQAIDPDQIRTQLRATPQVAAVFLTHSETSTGVATGLEEVARIIRENSDALVVADGISAVGALPLKFDDWGIDLVVTASQKGLMIPPGLAFVALSPKAWVKVRQSDLPKYYLSFLKAKEALEQGTTPFTPAITLFQGLQQSLKMIQEEGIEKLWRRHQLLAKATREGIKALGLEVFAKTPSDSLTAVVIPEGVDGGELMRVLREKYRVTVAGGQGQLKGKIFRIAHLGYYDQLDMVSVISALELTLADLGWRVEVGAGVRAIQRVNAESSD